jgi:ribose 5-phosphate isomerase A
MSEVSSDQASADRFKREAAARAVDLVQSGMVVGLGAGSTALWGVRLLAERLRDGTLRDVVGIPCSSQTEAEARARGVPLTTLEEHPVIDLTFDGADEVDPQLNLIKGGGGALLREKIVAQASRREVIVVDEGKLSPLLGTRWALPVEVIPFGWRSQALFLESLGAAVTLRQGPNSGPFKTDEGHLILDCRFGQMHALAALAQQLAERAGIVEHGLFLGLATDLLVASAGGVRHLTRPPQL